MKKILHKLGLGVTHVVLLYLDKPLTTAEIGDVAPGGIGRIALLVSKLKAGGYIEQPGPHQPWYLTPRGKRVVDTLTLHGITSDIFWDDQLNLVDSDALPNLRDTVKPAIHAI